MLLACNLSTSAGRASAHIGWSGVLRLNRRQRRTGALFRPCIDCRGTNLLWLKILAWTVAAPTLTVAGMLGTNILLQQPLCSIYSDCLKAKAFHAWQQGVPSESAPCACTGSLPGGFSSAPSTPCTGFHCFLSLHQGAAKVDECQYSRVDGVFHVLPGGR